MVRYSNHGGYHSFVVTSPAHISKKKQAWYANNKFKDADIIEEDPNIGVADGAGEDIEELHEDAAEDERDAYDAMNTSGGGTAPHNTPRVTLPDPKLYLSKKWMEPIVIPGHPNNVEQTRIILDIAIACMEEVRDEEMRNNRKYSFKPIEEEDDDHLYDSLDSRDDHTGNSGGGATATGGGGGGSGGGAAPAQAAAADDDGVPPITFFFDGDHPQIEAMMQYIIKHKLAKFNKIDCFKFPGGCTMSFQPNDLMKSFSILKDYFNQIKAKIIPLPTFHADLMAFLKKEGIQKRSLDTYGCYFHHVLQMEAKAFPPMTIASGWERAGIYPYSFLCIMRSNPKFCQLSSEKVEKFMAAEPQLYDYAEVHGRVNEDHMISLLGIELLNTRITNIQLKPINQQRAMILNNDSSIALKNSLQQRRKEREAEESAKKQKSKEEKEKREKARVDLVDACLQGPPSMNRTCMNVICSNNCDLGQPLESDKNWIGCPICKVNWACSKVSCQKLMEKHRLICHLRKFG